MLQLPDGFQYWSYSWTGDVMSDGVLCPSLHDGMAVVDEWHDDDDDKDKKDEDDRWDDHRGTSGRDADTTNLMFDARRGKLAARLVHTGWNREELCWWGDALGHLDHQQMSAKVKCLSTILAAND